MSENVKVKELPEMEDSDFKQCGNCIHLGNDAKNKDRIVCGAYKAYIEVAGELSNKFHFIEFDHCMQDLASNCENFIPKIGMITDKDLV